MATLLGTNQNDNLTSAQIIYGLGGDDTIIGNVFNAELYGGDGNDQIALNAAIVGVIDGGAGNDGVGGSNGADALYGGSGDDFINGVGGEDLIDGGDGNDHVLAAGGTVLGGAGDDTIDLSGKCLVFGGDGNDIVNGSADDDIISGGAGDDVLDGRAGRNILYGDDGNDFLMVGTAFTDVANRVLGGSGIDTVSFDLSLHVINLDLATGLNDVPNGEDDFVSGVENVIGSRLSDSLYGDAGANTITGNEGMDLLDGRAGEDTASYADKTLAVQVQLNSSAIVDVLVDGVVEDGISNFENVIGGSGNDILRGDGLANRFFGGLGHDSLRGMDGNDVLDGGPGDDFMSGGDGDDTFFVDDAADSAVDITGPGIDTVIASVSYALTSAGGGIQVENLTLVNVATAISATGNALANVLIGNSFANTLTGALGADTLIGGLGNDVYVLGAEATGVDTVSDSGGIDTIMSTITRSLLSYGPIENLTLLGLANVNGTGNRLANSLTGNDGNNALDGGVGNDQLFGLDGNDVLTGGTGRDVSSGGLGNDVFRFAGRLDSVRGTLRDVISDFDDFGNDRIDLRGVYQGTLAYRHNAAFTAAGQLRINDIAGADLIVEVNIGGTLAADMQIRLTDTGIGSMRATDFLL